jgi:plasmid stability protein
VRKTKISAIRDRRSVKAEHREILRQALRLGRSKQSLKEMLLAMPNVGCDADFARMRDDGRE